MKNNKVINKFEATMIACNNARALTEKKKNKMTKRKITESRRRKLESDDIDDEDDVVDDIVVVTDPDLDPEDMDSQIDDLQSIVDETPDGETPTIDDYIDDYVYTCPVCGNNFFSDEEMSSGDTCPVCGEVPDNFILVGDVQEADDIDDDDVVDDIEDDIDDEDDVVENRKRTRSRRSRIKAESIYVDEKTFNPLLTKFVKENYKNAKSMSVSRAIKVGRNIRLECIVKFRSGRSCKTNVTIENFRKSPNLTMNCKLDSLFKAESKRSKHMTFTGKLIKAPASRALVIKAEKMNYNFTCRNEGKRYRVLGSYKFS